MDEGWGCSEVAGWRTIETEREVGGIERGRGKMSQLIYLPVSMTTEGLSHPLSPYSVLLPPRPTRSHFLLLISSQHLQLVIQFSYTSSVCTYLFIAFYCWMSWKFTMLLMFLMSFKHVIWKVRRLYPGLEMAEIHWKDSSWEDFLLLFLFFIYFSFLSMTFFRCI